MLSGLNAFGVALTTINSASVGDAESLTKLGFAFKALSKEKVVELAANNNLSESLLRLALDYGKVDDEIAEEIVSYYSSVVAKGADKVATESLTFSMSNLTTAIWANIKAIVVWLATNPVGWLLSIGTAVVGTMLAVEAYNKKIDETIKQAQELQTQYDEASNSIKKNLNSIEELGDEFAVLSKGVNAYGENISLTSDEYNRYLSIVQQLIDINPTLVKGYNTEGNAIIDKNAAIQDTIDLLKEQQKLELINATTADANWTIAEGLRNSYRRTADEAHDAAVNVINSFKSALMENASSNSGVRGAVDLIGERDSQQVFKRFSELFDMAGEIQGSGVNDTQWSNLFNALVSDFSTAQDAIRVISDNMDEFTDLLSPNGEMSRAFVQSLREWTALERQMNSAATSYQSQMRLIAQAADGYGELENSSIEFVDAWIQDWKLTGDESEEDISRLTTQIGNLVGTLSDNDSLQQAVASLFAVDWDSLTGQFYRSALESAEKSIVQIASAFGWDMSGEEVAQLRIALGITFVDPITKEPIDARTHYTNQLKSLGFSEDIDFDSLTTGQLELAMRVDPSTIHNTEELAQAVDELGHNSLTGIGAVTDLATAISKFSDSVEHWKRLHDAFESLKDLNGNDLPVDMLAEIIELCPEAAGKITDVASAQKALEDAIVSAKDSAAETYGTLQWANEDWVESTLNDSEMLTDVLSVYYGNDLSRWRDVAQAKWKIDSQLVNNLSGLWAKYIGMTNRELTSLMVRYDNAYAMGRLTPDSDEYQSYKELQAFLLMRKEIQDLFEDFDDPTTNSKIKTPAERAREAFEEIYNSMKHSLDMQEITIEEFYAWLDGNKGYKAYFKEQGDTLEDFWKYQKEVFDGLKEVQQGYLNDIDHEIGLLGDSEEEEAAIAALYRQKIALLVELKEKHEDYLLASGVSDDEIARNDEMQEYVSLIHDATTAILDLETKVYERRKDNINAIIELTEEMIKQQKEDEKEALENQKESYKDIIDLQKSMLELTREEEKYRESVAEKTKRLAEIEAKLAVLKLDDSREARLEEGALMEEQAELQKELNDEQKDHFVDSAKDALDAELKEFEKQQDEKIKIIDDFLDDNNAVHKAALLELDNMNESLYLKLESYALHYTDTTRDELLKMWSDATDAAEKYGSVANASQVYEDGSVDSKVQAILRKMRENGSRYATATSEERTALANDSLAQGKKLQDLLGIPVYRDTNGTWWIGDKKLFEVYHSGTPSVGGMPTPKQNEMFSLLENREMVLTQKHQDNFWSLLSNLSPVKMLKDMLAPVTSGSLQLAGAGGPNVTVETALHMYGNLNDETMRALKEHPREVAAIVSKELRKL